MTDQPRDETPTAMYPFSFDLCAGMRHFAERACATDERRTRRYLNAAAVTFAAACIEAVLSEQISIRAEFGPDVNWPPVPKPLFGVLASSQKSLSLRDRWNLFAAARGGKPWDSGREPFQSYDLIITLRNEALHYKASFLPPEAYPFAKVRDLAVRLSVDDGGDVDQRVWIERLLEADGFSRFLIEAVDYGELLCAVLKREA